MNSFGFSNANRISNLSIFNQYRWIIYEKCDRKSAIHDSNSITSYQSNLNHEPWGKPILSKLP